MERKKIVLYTFVTAGVMIFLFLPGYSELQKLREKSDDYLRRIELLEEKNAKLEIELERMTKDPYYQEKKAREKYGLIKKGEIVYRPSNSE